MPNQTNQIDVSVETTDGSTIDFTGVNFISFVTGETYGIPALISEDRVKQAGLPVKILYVNPTNIATMQAVRKA